MARFSITTKNVDAGLPAGQRPSRATPASPRSDHPVDLAQDAATVFGSSDDKRLIVVNDPIRREQRRRSRSSPLGSRPTRPRRPTPSPTAATAAAPRPRQRRRRPPPPETPPARRLRDAAAPPSQRRHRRPTPTPAAGRRRPDASRRGHAVARRGAIEIAHDVVLVGQSAAYSPRRRLVRLHRPARRRLAGPDIYLWKVGDAGPTPSRPTTVGLRLLAGDVAGRQHDRRADDEQRSVGRRAPTSNPSFLLDPARRAHGALPQTGEPGGRPSTQRAACGLLVGHRRAAGRLRARRRPARDRRLGTGTAAPTDGRADAPATRRGPPRDDDQRRPDGRLGRPLGSRPGPSSRSGSPTARTRRRHPSLYAVDPFDGGSTSKKPLLDASALRRLLDLGRPARLGRAGRRLRERAGSCSWPGRIRAWARSGPSPAGDRHPLSRAGPRDARVESVSHHAGTLDRRYRAPPCDPGWSQARRSPPPSPWLRYRASPDRQGQPPPPSSTRQRSSRSRSQRSRRPISRSSRPTAPSGRGADRRDDDVHPRRQGAEARGRRPADRRRARRPTAGRRSSRRATR